MYDKVCIQAQEWRPKIPSVFREYFFCTGKQLTRVYFVQYRVAFTDMHAKPGQDKDNRKEQQAHI